MCAQAPVSSPFGALFPRPVTGVGGAPDTKRFSVPTDPVYFDPGGARWLKMTARVASFVCAALEIQRTIITLFTSPSPLTSGKSLQVRSARFQAPGFCLFPERTMTWVKRRPGPIPCTRCPEPAIVAPIHGAFSTYRPPKAGEALRECRVGSLFMAGVGQGDNHNRPRPSGGSYVARSPAHCILFGPSSHWPVYPR